MDALKMELSHLMKQRELLRFNFCSFKQNNVDNTQKLLALTRLLDNNYAYGLYNARTTADIMAYLATETAENKTEIITLLSLKLMVSPEIQPQLLPLLIANKKPWLQLIALEVAEMLGEHLSYNFDFISIMGFELSAQNNALALHGKTSLLVSVLLHLYQRKTLNTYLSVVLPDDTNNVDPPVKISPLIRLYIDILSGNDVNIDAIAEQLISHNLLQSTLFDIFVSSLDEVQVTAFINKLSTEELHTESVIYAMALSGYIKFIPFITQYLQQPAFATHAHNALRLVLGEKLDAFIPLDVQFDSDSAQKTTNLGYYSAKILNAWQQQQPLLLGFDNREEYANDKSINKISRMLNGQSLSIDTLDSVVTLGSQWHRYVAMLYKQHFTNQTYVNHPHALEVC